MFYKAFLAKGLFEKYIQKNYFVKAFLWFKKGLFKIQFLFALCKKKPLGLFTLILWKVVLIMKTCLLLFCMVILNFRNFAKLVWINLDQIWKGCEEIKKTEIEKEKRRNKNRIGPRGKRSGLVPEAARSPPNLTRNGTQPLSFPRWQHGPARQTSASSSSSRWLRRSNARTRR
jgi:hypothetical protein